MIINYNSLSNGRDTWLKNDVGEVVGSPPINLQMKKYSSWLLNLFLVWCVFFASNGIFAQVANYTFANGTSTYTPITGTVWQSGSTVSTDLLSGQIPLGFTFRYNNKNYTSVSISNNGYIVFGNVLPAVNVYPVISNSSDSGTATNAYEGVIAGFAANLLASTGTPSIRYGADGTDFVIQYADMARSGQTAERINFQIRLSQTTNVIKMIYGTCTASIGATYPQVGLRGASYLDWRNLTGTTVAAWSSPTSQASVGTATSSSTVRFSTAAPAAAPVSGTTYTYTPAAPAATPLYATIPAIENFDASPWINGASTANIPSANWGAWPTYGDRSWRRNNAVLSVAGWVALITDGAYTVTSPASGGAARFHTYGATRSATGYMDYYVNFNTPGEKKLSFDFINVDQTSNLDNVKIYLSTDGGATFGSALGTAGLATTWTSQSVILGTSESATCVIRFEATSDWGNSDMGIDNVSVALNNTAPNCIALPTTPANAATGITSGVLIWPAPAGGASGYSFYFGTDGGGVTTPTNVANGTALGNVLTTTLSLSSLVPNTTYYWQVIPTNTNGPATGCAIWSFTTAPTPNCATNFVPANLAVGIARNGSLSWTAPTSPTATSYDIYIGTTSNPPLVINQASVTYSPGLLLANTTYYWKVVPKNSMGAAVGPCIENSFTTGTNLIYCKPTITVGCTDGDVIARVTLNTLDNLSGITCTAGTSGYSDFTNYSANPGWTTTLQAGSTYNLSLYLTQYGEAAAAWIDYNDDGVFDNITEKVGSAMAAGSNVAGQISPPTSFPISLACNPPVGLHRMRLRIMYNRAVGSSTVAVPSDVTPCGNNDYGEVEDYIINITEPAACPQPSNLAIANYTPTSANLSWVKGCAETSWKVVVQPLGTGIPTSGAGVTVTGTGTTITYPATFAAGTNEFYVSADCTTDGYSVWSGPFIFGPPSCTTAVSPLPAATGVIINSPLSWAAAPIATSYDVYYGTTSGALALGINTTATLVNVNNQAFETTYYWRIVPKNAQGIATGCTEFSYTTQLAPPSETCASAISLNALTSPFNGTTVGFANNFYPNCDGSEDDLNAGDAFYSITVPADYTLNIGQTANNYDSIHTVFYGSCSAGFEIDCVDGISDASETIPVIWKNTTGSPMTIYWVQDGYEGDEGTFTLAWTLTPPPLAIASIDNDSTCANDLASTGIITLTGSQITGVTSVDLNGIAVNYTVVNNTTIEITLIPANYASYTSGTFAVHSSTPVAYSPPFTINIVDPIPNTVNPTSVCLGEELTFFNEVPGEWTSDDISVATILGTGQLTPLATGTVNLRYTVSNPETGCTSFRLYPITVNEPVYVVSNTLDPTAAEGGSTTISVAVDGTGPYTYLWEVKADLEAGDFEPITLPGFSNINSANLLLINADAAYDGYQLRCTITGACGSTQTEAIDLHVQATGFETQPAATVTVCAHNTTPVSFSVVASPDVTTYEWFVNTGGIFYTSVVDGGIFSGQGTATLSLTNVTIDNNGWKFRCFVTGNAEATSSFGTLIVNDSPAITLQPNSPEVCFSGAVNTPITLTSTGASSYQWLYSTSLNGEYLPVANGTPAGSLYSGASTANLGVTTTTATPVATYYYKVNLISSCSTLLSDAAQLTINGATITGQPAATALIPGGSASYTVAATTSLTASYQWQYSTSATTGFVPVANGIPAGATYTTASGGATLNIATLGTTPLGTSNFYRAVVTSGINGCAATSNAARLTIASYCSSITFTTDIEPITSVVFAGIDNTSSATPGDEPAVPALQDFTSIIGNVTTQNTYEMRLKGNSVGDYTNNYRVFIDWNKDGDFADAGETYNAGTTTNSTGVDGITAVSSITVPAGALPGITRMRVKKIFGTDDLANPCLGAGYGQVEDYSLNVTVCTPVSWYADTDNDGYGNTATLTTACISPAGTWVHVGGDCDDTNIAIYRTGNFYVDADNDGYTVGGLVSVCYGLNTPTGYKATSLGTDCDDNNNLIYRTGFFYVDADNDTFYNGGLAQTEQCYGATTPSGFVPVGDNSGTDCDDTNGQINSNHVEVLGNETDDNCDGTNNEVAPLSNLLASHCGTTLAHISNTLFAVQAPGAQGYRFEISINGTNPRYYDSPTYHFSLLNVPGGVLYNTTYTVRVAVKTNDFWRAYSTTCLVTTPPIPAKTFISPAQCGTTLASMSTTIFAVQATAANQYRFEVSDGVSAARTYDSAVNRFSFAALGGLSYNTTYAVRVALRFGTTWEDYGTACNITTPATPPTSNVIPSLCGTTISNGWTTIYAMQVPEATGYRFNVTAPGVTRFYDTPNNRFSLRNIASFTVTPNTTYTITVQILYNGFYQTAGSACTITTAGVVTRQAETAVSIFDVKAYPNPYADTFKLDMNTSSEEVVNVKVYDMLGKQIESREFNVSELGNQEVGNRYSSGVYNIIVTQGENVKTLRVIKR